jgi:putative MATE family efflux protein
MKDLTRGSIPGQIMGLATLQLVNSVASRALSLLNIYWLGKLGAAAQAAVTVAINPLLVVLSVSPVMSVGARVLVAQAVGARDHERASKIFNEALGATLLVVAALGALGWANRASFADWLSPDARTSALISEFLKWMVFSVGLQIPVALISAALGGTGNMKPGTFGQLAMVGVNFVLTPLLVFGWAGFPRLGVAGAGLASFISVLSCLAGLSLYCAHVGSYLRLRPGLWLSRPQTLWSVLKVGSPMGVQSGVSALYMMCITFFLQPFGPTEQAAFGVGQRLYQFAVIPLSAVGGAASVVVGQNYGAKRRDRVMVSFRGALLLGLACVPLPWLIAQFFPESISRLFSDEPAVVAGSAEFLRTISYCLFPVCVLYAVNAVLSGIGNTLAILITSTTYAVAVALPAWMLSYHPAFRPEWIWDLTLLGIVLETLGSLLFLRHELRSRLSARELPAPAHLTKMTFP